jgi:hypothetical protein
MNIARLLKADERSDLFNAVTGRSARWHVSKSLRPERAFLHRQYPAVSAPRQIKHHRRKSPTPDLLWIDMITNALIVIVIASASYFFISAKAFRAHTEPAVISYSEPSQPR